ncbi:hypothetical protein CRV08_07485 [Halarcobacter ebronensis]|uniref:DNA-binding protein n=1 Tax=Halarcobacter ebronensis TaxID=1462615 RepID=A0A4Q0YG26_9BACT|nr:hypothetical protein [Halarcobacter ebronensis]RXJ68654.1 hypothetical protein CRV08_07485 [Halarcobacter ebronensis]
MNEYNELLKFNIEVVKKSIPNIEKSIGATKKELAVFMRVSESTINRAIAEGGYGIPEYIKGKGEKGHISFPLINIALFITNSINKSA